MREVDVSIVRDAVRSLYIEACVDLGEDVRTLLREAHAAEESPAGRETLRQIIENFEIAAREKLPICQDTGAAVVFLSLGQGICLTGGSLREAVDEGVRMAVRDGALRASIVSDPIERINTGDNTPAVLHVEIVDGDEMEIIVAPKGFGSENMSRLYMLSPSEGREGIINAIVNTARQAGGNPCPPIILGVGIGGTAEQAMLTAKKSLLREAGYSQIPAIAGIERESLRRVNALGIGPMGLGGRITALAVYCEVLPTHIASLPVAVNVQCHCARHKAAKL